MGVGASLKFSVHFGGAAPGWHWQKPELFAAPLTCPAFISGGLTDTGDGSRADPGNPKMCALVHPAVLVAHPHPEGHRPFAAERTAATAAAEALVAFIRKAMTGGFPPPPLPAPPAAVVAPAAAAVVPPAIPSAASTRPAGDVSAGDVSAGDVSAGHAAATAATAGPLAAAGSEMLAFLDSLGLSHLGELLGSASLPAAKELLVASRVEFLADLKAKGVAKLAERQLLANKLSKAVKEGTV